MGKRFGALWLAVIILLCCAVGAGATIVEYVGGEFSAVHMNWMRNAETFVEVTVKSLAPFSYPNLGPDEGFDNGDALDPYDVFVSVDKNLYGAVIREGQISLILYLGYGIKMEEGKRYILALAENNPVERKRLAESSSAFVYDPGKYAAWGILEIQEDGSLRGMGAANDYHIESFDRVINQIEGREPLESAMRFESPVMYYNCQLIQRAYVTESATVYKMRDSRSKKLIALQPYDFVLQVGHTDRIYGKSWDKILLADGSLG